MSRKDYEALAAALRHAYVFANENDTLDESGRDAARRAIGVVTVLVGDALAADNSRFDRARFNEAAGLSDC